MPPIALRPSRGARGSLAAKPSGSMASNLKVVSELRQRVGMPQAECQSVADLFFGHAASYAARSEVEQAGV